MLKEALWRHLEQSDLLAKTQGVCGRNKEGVKFLSDFQLHVLREILFSPLKASPAPLTRTWEWNDTILEVCIAESFPALFFIQLSSSLWLQVGEVRDREMYSMLSQSDSCLKSPFQLAFRERPVLKREMAVVVEIAICKANSWDQSRVGQQQVSLLSFCLVRMRL